MAGNWTDAETRELLSVRSIDEIDRQLSGTARDAIVYERLTKILNDRGVRRQKAQIISKLKSLRKKFHQVNEYDGNSAKEKLYWSYFEQCDSIWGVGHSTNTNSTTSVEPVVAVVTSVKEEEEEEETSTTNFSSNNGEAEVDSTKEECPLSEGEASAADSQPESPQQPPRKRAKKLSRAQQMAADVKKLFSEMDSEFHARENARLQEQRKYDERVRRESREHEQKLLEQELEARERHMAMWVEAQECQNNILRELMDRMPLPSPPHSVHFVDDNYDELKIDL